MGACGVRRPAAAPLAPLLVAVLVVGWLVAGCGSSAPDPDPGRARSLTLTYAPGLTADMYLPRNPGRAPLVVLVPGGGWTTADPTGLTGLAHHLADAGIVAAPVHIRAAVDGVGYPTPVEDVLCAVAAVVGQARSRGFPPARVAVLGHSSGAHLAALAVLAFEDYDPGCLSPVVEPDALIGLSGPYDVSRVPWLATALLGSDPAEDPELWHAANPVQRAALRPDVPALLLHGADDDVVPVDFTTQLADALEGAGHPTTVEVVAGAAPRSILAPPVGGDRVASWLLGSH